MWPPVDGALPLAAGALTDCGAARLSAQWRRRARRCPSPRHARSCWRPWRAVLAAVTIVAGAAAAPRYLLDELLASGRAARASVVCTQPRRIAAMAVADQVLGVAERVAEERDEARPSPNTARRTHARTHARAHARALVLLFSAQVRQRQRKRLHSAL